MSWQSLFDYIVGFAAGLRKSPVRWHQSSSDSKLSSRRHVSSALHGNQSRIPRIAMEGNLPIVPFDPDSPPSRIDDVQDGT